MKIFQTALATGILLLCLAGTDHALASPVFESASLGTTGIDASGAIINSVQWVGVRFSLSTTIETSAIGGHFDAFSDNFGNGLIFGAIVALDDFDDFPDTGDLSSGDVLGTTLLTLPELTGSSADLSAALELTLSAGDYALIFGSGRFGATGRGQVATNNSLIGSPSFLVRNSNLADPYFDTPLSDTRFFVEGNTISVVEPGTILLFAWLLGLIKIRRISTLK